MLWLRQSKTTREMPQLFLGPLASRRRILQHTAWVTWRNNLNFLNFLNHLKEVTLPTILVGRMDSKDVGKSLPEKKRFCLREAPFRALRISVAPRWSVENDRLDNGKTKRKYHPIKPVKLQWSNLFYSQITITKTLELNLFFRWLVWVFFELISFKVPTTCKQRNMAKWHFWGSCHPSWLCMLPGSHVVVWPAWRGTTGHKPSLITITKRGSKSKTDFITFHRVFCGNVWKISWFSSDVSL